MRRPSFVWLSPTLTRLGKRFGIDAHYFAKNSALVLIGHAIGILRGIVTGYLVARLFNQETYGQYQFMLSVVGMLALLGLPGIGNPVARAWARDEAFSLRRITMQQLKACLIGSFVLLACIPFLGYYGRQELWPLFLAAAILFPLPPIAMVHFGGFTVGKSRFDISLRAGIVWSIIMTLATLGVVLFHESALLMLIIGMTIPSLTYVWYSRGFTPPVEKGTKNTDAIIKYGWQLTFATLPVDLIWYLDKLMISQFFGLNQLATFSIALLVPEQAKIFLKQFLPISFAKQAAGNDTQDRRRKLMKAVLLGMLVFAVGIAVYIVLCPFLMPILFPNYDATEITLLTSVAALTLITMPGALFSQYMEARGMIRQIRIANWVSAVLFALSIVTLIPFYGLVGAMLARGIFRVASLCMSGWFVMRAPLQQGLGSVRKA